MITVRRLEPHEGALFRRIRLEALSRSPEGFASTAEEEGAKDAAYFSGRLVEGGCVFVALDGDTPVGMVGFDREAGQQKAHKGTLRGMYVAPEARGTGTAEALIGAVFDHARANGVEQVQLTVKAVNERAWRVYERLGFIRWGVEPQSLRSPQGEYFDDVHMWKPV
jgi:RimJ/RimL family protein N-acetyltransferase